jgi:hypothetical protein
MPPMQCVLNNIRRVVFDSIYLLNFNIRSFFLSFFLGIIVGSLGMIGLNAGRYCTAGWVRRWILICKLHVDNTYNTLEINSKNNVLTSNEFVTVNFVIKREREVVWLTESWRSLYKDVKLLWQVLGHFQSVVVWNNLSAFILRRCGEERLPGAITNLHQQAYKITGSSSRSDYSSSASPTLGAASVLLGH